jgi:exopolysaccharide production protein ExoF
VLARQDSLTIPPQIRDDAEAPVLAESETTILKTGQDQIKSQTVALDAQKQLLTKSIDALSQKRDTATQQLTLAQDRLQKVQTLATNGLAITDRVMTLQSNVADLEGQLLDIDTADLKAKQDVTVADTQSAKLVSDALLQASQDRQDVDAQIAQAELKMATQQKLIQDAVSSGAAPVTAGAVTYSYTILRDGQEIPAGKADALRPGDVVTVAITMTP